MKIKMVTDKFKPTYGTQGSAGFDLYCNNKEPITVGPGQIGKVDTGIKVSIPKGYFGAVYPRSSTGIKHNISLANTVGIIDSDYRGEIQLFFVNNSDKEYTIEHGERLAQMIIQPYVKADIELVDELDQTERGEGGIGSTGK